MEALHRGFQQPDASVIAELRHVAGELTDVPEDRMIAIVGFDGEFWGLEEDDLSRKITDEEGDGLSEIAVRGVAHQTGAGVCFLCDDHG